MDPTELGSALGETEAFRSRHIRNPTEAQARHTENKRKQERPWQARDPGQRP